MNHFYENRDFDSQGQTIGKGIGDELLPQRYIYSHIYM